MTLPLCLLDFDGVLFDSAQEAYLVCQEMANSGLTSRNDVNISEFMMFRKLVKDAWHFAYLYNKPNQPLPNTPSVEDKRFASDFFKTREVLTRDKEWLNMVPSYDFFKGIKKYMLNHPTAFKIISTRNEESILGLLEANGVHGIDVFGQKIIKESGGKVRAAMNADLLGRKCFTLYIDDMLEYTSHFSGKVDLAMHASWGYGHTSEKSIPEKCAIAMIDALFMGLSNEI